MFIPPEGVTICQLNMSLAMHSRFRPLLTLKHSYAVAQRAFPAQICMGKCAEKPGLGLVYFTVLGCEV